jgi:N-dimethylarginine dimethylaminohydrolase
MSLPACVLRDANDLPPGFRVEELPALPHPTGVLMCPPDHFAVVDVKNPHMAGNVGRVDRAKAAQQWVALRSAFDEAGLLPADIAPTADCEDMVFTANQTFTGPDAAGRPTCLLSSMRHPSRRREVPAFEEWFTRHGWRIVGPFPPEPWFEGGGDALWHPGRRLIWCGHGFRTGAAVQSRLVETFGCPVFSLALLRDTFYHLDTCLCPLDEHAALYVRSAFTDEGRALLARGFEHLYEVDADEASKGFACNAAGVSLTRSVVIDRRAVKTARLLRGIGYRVIEVDTGEFLKSGGSVFCMKQWLW